MAAATIHPLTIHGYLSCSQQHRGNSRQTDFIMTRCIAFNRIVATRAAICLSLAGNGSNCSASWNFSRFVRALRAELFLLSLSCLIRSARGVRRLLVKLAIKR